MTRREEETESYKDSYRDSGERAASVAVGRRVLVVEDETRLREMLNRAVRDMGFEIQCVGSAEAAMRIFESQPVDITIVDLNLPGMGGMEFIEAIHGRWPDTQPIVMTGFGNLQSCQARDARGCRRFSDQAVRAGRSGSCARSRPATADGQAPRACRRFPIRRKNRVGLHISRRPGRWEMSRFHWRKWNAGISWRRWKRTAAIEPSPHRNWGSVCESCITGWDSISVKVCFRREKRISGRAISLPREAVAPKVHSLISAQSKSASSMRPLHVQDQMCWT